MDNTQPASFKVVDLSADVVTIQDRFIEPSLAAQFGDYRPAREQRIGIGDAIAVTIWEAGPGGLFSAPVVDRDSPGSRSASIPSQVVARDGAITVPFAGRVAVAGQTPPQVEATIVAKLAGKAIDPQALVTLTGNISNTVTVTGDVAASRRVPLGVAGDRLLDVLAEAGGARSAPYDVDVVLARADHVARVSLQAVLNNPREDVFLQPQDVVTLVPDRKSFTAAGAIERPAVVPFEAEHLSLDQAMGRVGGVNDDRGDPDGVFVIRYEQAELARALPGTGSASAGDAPLPVVYHLRLRAPNALFVARRFAMRDKDILYVADAPLTDLQKVFSLINLLVGPVVAGASVNYNLK